MNITIAKIFMIQRPKDNKGYILLLSVLVVGAVGVAIATSLLLLGLGSSRNSLSLEQSDQAKAVANACAEEALQQIRDNASFSGSNNLTLGQGTCLYSVTNLGGNNRQVVVSGTVGILIRKLTISVTAISPSIIIGSWQEGP